MSNIQSSSADSFKESEVHSMSKPIEGLPDERTIIPDERSSSHIVQTAVSVPLSATGTKCQQDPTIKTSAPVSDVQSSALVDSSTKDVANQRMPPSEESHEKGESMKHLTCYFWWENGRCKYPEEDCLYSHAETGRVAGPPTQVEPGAPAVAGSNAKAPEPVYVNWRGHHGLHYGHKRGTINSNHRSEFSPIIQEQIRHINQKAQFNEKHNNWPVHHSHPSMVPGTPIRMNLPSSYDAPLTPYQQPPGIFSPTPPYSYNELLSNPTHYHLPPPEPGLIDQLGSYERQKAELQAKLEKSEAENKRLLELVQTLGDALICADAVRQDAFAAQGIFGATGIKLLSIHKQLDDLPFRRHPDVKAVRDKVLRVGKDLMDGMTKQRVHLSELDEMKDCFRPQVVESEDKQGLAKVDAGEEGVGSGQMTALPNEQ